MSNGLGRANGMNMMDDNKSKALAAALAQIEKQFGKGSIMKMGEAQVQNDLSVVSTGSLGLDIALGVGGLPRGRVVEIYGPESSGKTTLALQVVSQVQKAAGIAAYIDAENALDPVYAGKLGVNVGESAGQTVGHVHIHLIPRYPGDVDDPRGGIRWIIPAKAHYWEQA